MVDKRGSDVIIGPNEALFSRRVRVEQVNFVALERLEGPVRARAKLRYTPSFAACTMPMATA